jgi:Uma2 family endonuclease
MSILTPPTPVTPEDLLSLPDGKSYELVDGRLMERHMGLESSKIALRIAFLIAQFIQDRRLGDLFGSDASYQCFPQAPQEVRRADLSFIRAGRFEGGRLPKGHCRIPPDLAVEVISPGDLAYDVEEKVAMYLAAGVKSVWVVYPPTKVVRVHRRGSSSELTADDTITEPELLPGFSSKVAEFFV